MDAELQELKRNQEELAFAVAEAVAADFAKDEGDEKRYRELNTQARERVKRLLTRMGISAAGEAHIRGM